MRHLSHSASTATPGPRGTLQSRRGQRKAAARRTVQRPQGHHQSPRVRLPMPASIASWSRFQSTASCHPAGRRPGPPQHLAPEPVPWQRCCHPQLLATDLHHCALASETATPWPRCCRPPRLAVALRHSSRLPLRPAVALRRSSRSPVMVVGLHPLQPCWWQALRCTSAVEALDLAACLGASPAASDFETKARANHPSHLNISRRRWCQQPGR
mmetsp:Transcript_61362/g.142812  ORF Transcript_61362/g.142812 Transcript_61362/m.142812 type:complete len:213 (-) Transcript_61362:153-791(-)